MLQLRLSASFVTEQSASISGGETPADAARAMDVAVFIEAQAAALISDDLLQKIALADTPEEAADE
jgi:hypothetical protein